MHFTFIRVGTCLLLTLLGGCQPAARSQFKDGAKLYDKQTHEYFGKVVGYEDVHDFHNGTTAQPAILIESSDGGATARTWGACNTCAATFDVKP